MREWLLMERRRRNMTQLELATKVGISRAYLTQLELQLRNPSIKVAKKLGTTLSIDWTRFFEDLEY
ncbi:MAG: helix-turn-helix transcriptional regulator [Clostridiaceae bacterium]|nr:helix-turn-helix transcriptional regulator [Clostridiaceae bacterium]